MERGCATYCGYQNQYCCNAGEVCTTSNDIAGCSVGAGGGGGGYAWYTTTWTETATYTKTYSSYLPAQTTATGKCIPPEGSGQIACGSICCASWQYCAKEGQCMANGAPGEGGGAGGGWIPTTITTGGTTITTQFSAPYRVTSGTATDTAIEATATSTEGVAPGGTAGSSLSGGAIAGIVVGTLAGVALLLLLCACCVVRGLWHGVMAVLGLGKKKKSETIIEEERYTRRGSGHSRRDTHSSWYGGASRPSGAGARKEKKSDGKGLLGLGAALGTLWLLLGLKRDKKKKPAKTRSDVSSSYWSDSYTADSPSK